jgi:endonuclease-3
MGTRSRDTTSAAPAATQVGLAEPARVGRLVELLAARWPDAVVELDHRNAFELLCATILAAQSTDRMINTITPALFARWPDARALATADPAELEVMIHKSGFFRMKAKHLLGMARALVERHGGEVPRTMEELVALPGVARKTANVVLGSVFGIAVGIVVDTHVTRLSQRLGLTRQTDPVKIEADLCAVLPRDEWVMFAHRLIWHGRRVCHARGPLCGECDLAPLCPSALIPAAGDAVPIKAPAVKAAKAKPSAGTAKPAAKATAKPAAKATAKPAARATAKPAAKATAKPAAKATAKPAAKARPSVKAKARGRA